MIPGISECLPRELPGLPSGCEPFEISHDQLLQESDCQTGCGCPKGHIRPPLWPAIENSCVKLDKCPQLGTVVKTQT